MELKLSNLAKKHKPMTNWPKEKKIQVVAQWLALGNLRLVAASTNISYGLIRQWKIQPWWAEYEREIRSTENISMDADMTKIVNRSLEAVADRLEHGEVFYDQKTGELKKKPVLMKDAAKVATDLLSKRELLRGNATSRTEANPVPMADQLKALATEFARMAQGLPLSTVIDVPMVEIVDTEEEDEDDAFHEEWETGLRTGSETLHEQTIGSEEADGTERSTSGSSEEGSSS